MVVMYTSEEAGKLLKHSKRFVLRMIREGKLPASKFGSKYVINELDIINFLEVTKTNNEQESNNGKGSPGAPFEGC